MTAIRLFIRVTPWTNPDELGEWEPGTPTLYVYEADSETPDQGTYVAYNVNPDRQMYWSDWLRRHYYAPDRFVNRFGYSSVDAGQLRDNDHFRELLEKVGFGPELAREIAGASGL
jgi:hypothetical protein